MNKFIKILGLFASVSGTALGIDGLHTGISIGSTNTKLGFKIDRTDSSDLGNQSYNAGIFIGYNKLIEETPLLVGFELNAHNHNLKATQHEHTVPATLRISSEIKANNSASFLLKFGVRIKDLDLYAKAGISYYNWKTKAKHWLANYESKETSKTYDNYGLTYGMGIDYKLNPNWGIGIDYTNSTCNPLRMETKVGTLKINPMVHKTSFRVIYTF